MLRVGKYVLGLAVALLSAPTLAQLSSIDNGWYSSAGTHQPTNTNIVTGTCCDGLERRSFFVFDTTGQTEVTSLSITFFGGNGTFGTDTGSETVALFDYSGLVNALVGGTAGVSGFTDLGSGLLLGQETITQPNGSPMVEFTVALSSAFVSQFNAAIGAADHRVALGASLQTIGAGGPDDHFWLFSNNVPAARLNINPVIGAAVPEPSSWAMMLFGFGAMGVALRRRKHLTGLTLMS